jgi:hypothetical protein
LARYGLCRNNHRGAIGAGKRAGLVLTERVEHTLVATIVGGALARLSADGVARVAMY